MRSSRRSTSGTGGRRDRPRRCGRSRGTAVTLPNEATAVPAEVIRARAYLSRVAEPPAAALVRFVDTVGPVAAADRVRTGDVADAVAAETAARRTVDRAEADLATAGAAGA